jgi:hypothetical protein
MLKMSGVVMLVGTTQQRRAAPAGIFTMLTIPTSMMDVGTAKSATDSNSVLRTMFARSVTQKECIGVGDCAMPAT